LDYGRNAMAFCDSSLLAVVQLDKSITNPLTLTRPIRIEGNQESGLIPSLKHSTLITIYSSRHSSTHRLGISLMSLSQRLIRTTQTFLDIFIFLAFCA
jgi:hypothetical protein